MEISLASAYRQLSPTEKSFVDGFVADIETQAVREGVKLLTVMMRPVRLAEGDTRRSEMLTRALVRAAISERVHELSEAMELSAHRVIKELSAIAFSSVAHYMIVGEDGQPYFDMTKCTPEQLSAISSIDIEENMSPNGRSTRKFKFKLHDKIAGLDKFMRHMGLLNEDNSYWRSHGGRDVTPVVTLTLPGTATVNDAADAYARMING